MVLNMSCRYFTLIQALGVGFISLPVSMYRFVSRNNPERRIGSFMSLPYFRPIVPIRWKSTLVWTQGVRDLPARLFRNGWMRNLQLCGFPLVSPTFKGRAISGSAFLSNYLGGKLIRARLSGRIWTGYTNILLIIVIAPTSRTVQKPWAIAKPNSSYPPSGYVGAVKFSCITEFWKKPFLTKRWLPPSLGTRLYTPRIWTAYTNIISIIPIAITSWTCGPIEKLPFAKFFL